MIADKTTGEFLGIQVLGKGAVDKMVDIAVVALSMKATVQQLEHLDFAYAPPFSTAIHPFAHCINILLNKMSGSLDTFTPVEFAEGKAEGYKVIDASLKPTLEGVEFMNLEEIDGEVEGHPKDEKMLLVCAKVRGIYAAEPSEILRIHQYQGSGGRKHIQWRRSDRRLKNDVKHNSRNAQDRQDQKR